MRRWSAFARSMLGGLAAVPLVLLAAGPAAAGDDGGGQIRSVEVSLDVRPDGSLRVRETIGYDFGGTARHGIERDIDTEQRYDGSRDRRFPVSEIEVSSPTAPDQVQVTDTGRETRLRIGDPDRTVTGRHTYRRVRARGRGGLVRDPRVLAGLVLLRVRRPEWLLRVLRRRGRRRGRRQLVRPQVR